MTLAGPEKSGMPRSVTSSSVSVGLGPTTLLSRNDSQVWETTTGSNLVAAMAIQQACSSLVVPGLGDYAPSRNRQGSVVLTAVYLLALPLHAPVPHFSRR